MYEYTVVRNIDLGDFIKQVNDLINEGWEPIGGVVVVHPASGGFDVLYQSMVHTQVRVS